METLKYNENISDLLKSDKKNLIIGTITNYNWEKVEVFFNSYAMQKFSNCDCVMFVSYMSQSTIDKIKSRGVIVYEIPDKYKDMRIVDYRWRLYEEFLNENKDKYKFIFSADIRDTVFQKDVFKYFEKNKPFLGISLEDGILSERLNREWLITNFGEDIYKSMENERIICIGTL